ncbi:hypothetical protein EDD17DRAFT_1761084 [Pisolithus thermaeus]|nr:hypothetical protein EDD17DRAFT_1761084 [Pisolithus thermaeus]
MSDLTLQLDLDTTLVKYGHALSMSLPIPQSYFYSNLTVVWNAHLPQTIWDAKVFCCSSDSGYSDMMVDIEPCPGCCTGPLMEMYMSGTPELQLPWTSNPLGSHELQLDGELTKFDLCSSQELALGDYGISSVHNFIHHGNIFEDMQEYGIDSTDLAQEVVTASPVKSMIIGQGGAKKPLVLYQPKGLSLPDNEEFKLLLKALSICLAHKDLVTTVIQCSELNVEERWMDVGGDLMLDGGLRSVDQGTLIPLYTVARPLAWCKDPPHPEKRQEFKNIR